MKEHMCQKIPIHIELMKHGPQNQLGKIIFNKCRICDDDILIEGGIAYAFHI